MCALKSRGMSVVCTWGLRGIFFHTCNFLCSSPTVLCAFVQVLSSTYVPYNIPLSLILRILCSSTFVHTSDLLLTICCLTNFMLKYAACVLLTICVSPPLEASNFKPPSTTPPNSIAATIEFTSPCNQTSLSSNCDSNLYHHHVKNCPPL